MISYRPFYDTLFRKDLTEYNLIFKQGITASTLHRMKHGMGLNTSTLNILCKTLDCRVEDILEYVPDGEEKWRFSLLLGKDPGPLAWARGPAAMAAR